MSGARFAVPEAPACRALGAAAAPARAARGRDPARWRSQGPYRVNMRRPVIGLGTALERARWSVWDQEALLLPRSYAAAVQRAGGMALMLPLDEELVESPDQALELLDGLILAGGADIDPSFYGERRHAQTVVTMPARDAFEIALVRSAIARDMPVLGICRGMQLLNVALGGTLCQHLPERFGHSEHLRAIGSFDGADHDVIPLLGLAGRTRARTWQARDQVPSPPGPRAHRRGTAGGGGLGCRRPSRGDRAAAADLRPRGPMAPGGRSREPDHRRSRGSRPRGARAGLTRGLAREALAWAAGAAPPPERICGPEAAAVHILSRLCRGRSSYEQPRGRWWERGSLAPLVRRRLAARPIVTQAVALGAPVGLAVAVRRSWKRDVAVCCLQMWAYLAAYKLPHDDPRAQERRLRIDYPIAIDRVLGLGELPTIRLQRARAEARRVGTPRPRARVDPLDVVRRAAHRTRLHPLA